MFPAYEKWSGEPEFVSGVTDLVALRGVASDEDQAVTARLVENLLTAIVTGAKPDYHRLFDDDAHIEVVGLDRARIDGVGAEQSVTTTLFPQGFAIVVVQAAFSRFTGFIEAAIKGRVATTGRLYVSPMVISLVRSPSGLITNYREYTRVESLYDATRL